MIKKIEKLSAVELVGVQTDEGFFPELSPINIHAVLKKQDEIIEALNQLIIKARFTK